MSVYDKQLERRRQFLEQLQQQSLESIPSRTAGDRVVPFSYGEGLSKIAKALMARQGITRLREDEAKREAEKKAATATATKRLIETAIGKEQTGGPLRYGEGQPYQQFSPKVPANLPKAAIMASTDPALADNENINAVAQAMLKAQISKPSRSGYQIVPGAESGLVFDKGTGTMRVEGYPSGFTPAAYDVQRKGEIKSAETQAKKDVELVMDPQIKKQMVISEYEAEKTTGKTAEEMKLLGRTEQTDMLVTKIDSLIDRASYFTTGLASLASFVPGTPQHNIAKELDTIKASIGFEKLQQMREQSPTGGALGSISDRENVLLQSVWSSLEQSQSPEQFKANLEILKNQLVRSWGHIAAAYESTYGEPMGSWESVRAQLNENKADDDQSILDAANRIMGL